ncbi:hypothetical protein HK096_009814, partial [Nowakowskiella sp. JEL0078]
MTSVSEQYRMNETDAFGLFAIVVYLSISIFCCSSIAYIFVLQMCSLECIRRRRVQVILSHPPNLHQLEITPHMPAVLRSSDVVWRLPTRKIV